MCPEVGDGGCVVELCFSDSISLPVSTHSCQTLSFLSKAICHRDGTPHPPPTSLGLGGSRVPELLVESAAVSHT